jgi:FKBP-type peptidyl-prolyl cis-trans isomerase SlyD
MQVAPRTVVSIDYTLRDDEDGSVLDRSAAGDPLVYLHGVGTLVPGLEAALLGRAIGETVSVVLGPEDAYGDYDPGLVQLATRAQFDGDVAVGMQVEADDPDGPPVWTVVGVEGDDVTLDGNHPLAGRTLRFDVTVRDVRQATDAEMAHGHPHGPGEHDH